MKHLAWLGLLAGLCTSEIMEASTSNQTYLTSLMAHKQSHLSVKVKENSIV